MEFFKNQTPFLSDLGSYDEPRYIRKQLSEVDSRLSEIATELFQQINQVDTDVPDHIQQMAADFFFRMNHDVSIRGDGLVLKCMTTSDLPRTLSILNEAKAQHKKILDMCKRIWSPDSRPLTAKEDELFISCLKTMDFKDVLKLEYPLIDFCFVGDRSPRLYQYTMDCFKKDIPLFLEWIKAPNNFLIKNSELSKIFPSEELPNCVHAFLNKNFAQAVLKNIPPECWTSKLLFSLGGWGISDEVDDQYVRNFAKALDKTSDANVKSYFLVLASKINIPDFKEKTSPKKIILSANSLKKTSSKAGMAYVIGEMDEENWQRIHGALTPETAQKFVPIMLYDEKSTEKALKAKFSNGTPMIWSLYEKGEINEDIQQALRKAIEMDDVKFLNFPKGLHFSKDFPLYNELKQYFKERSAVQGMQFLKSFSWKGVNSEDHYEAIKDFIYSPSIQADSFKRLKVFNFWAKSGSSVKMLSACYGKNYETEQNPKLQIPYKDFHDLWTGVDENGKTPWHYICAKCANEDNKIFFNKKYKELAQTLLDVCSIKDKEGKTPLNYLSHDSKFLTLLVEKMPELRSKLEEQGIQFAYVHTKKEKKQLVESVKLAPNIPKTQQEIDENTPVEQQHLIEKAMHEAIEKNENLILRGKGRTFGLTCAVLKDIDSDATYKQDIVEHLQQFLSTPYSEKFMVGGSLRWKRFEFEGKEVISEMSFAPNSGHAQAMPRLYARKCFFTQDNNKWMIASKKSNKKKKGAINGVWVGVVKGDKRDQVNDAVSAKHIFFENDGLQRDGVYTENSLGWLFKDITQKGEGPKRLISPNIFPGGRG